MKKWIIIVVLAGMLGWVIYDYVEGNKEDEAKQETGVVSTDETDETSELDETVGIERGESAPDFALVTTTGEKVYLSDFKGQKVLLNFWATWCPPCRAEMPDLQKFHEDFGDDVAILGVNLTDTEAQASKIDDFLNEYAITFPILKDMDSSVASTYGAQALPTSYIIDREGKVFNKAIGPLNYESMVDVFAQIE